MIIAAFSTLGKTTYVRSNPGVNFDFEVNKLSKSMGFSGWDKATPDARYKLGSLLFQMDLRVFQNVFVTIPEILLYLPKGSICTLVIPKFGVNEFAERLRKRGKPLDEQDEWKILGGSNYIPAIRRYQEISKECKSRGIITAVTDVNYVSDLFKD